MRVFLWASSASATAAVIKKLRESLPTTVYDQTRNVGSSVVTREIEILSLAADQTVVEFSHDQRFTLDYRFNQEQTIWRSNRRAAVKTVATTIGCTFHYTKINRNSTMLCKCAEYGEIAALNDDALIKISGEDCLLFWIVKTSAVRTFYPERVTWYERLAKHNQSTPLLDRKIGYGCYLIHSCYTVTPHWGDLRKTDDEAVFGSRNLCRFASNYFHLRTSKVAAFHRRRRVEWRRSLRQEHQRMRRSRHRLAVGEAKPYKLAP
jgi:hypothetical protein